MPAPAPPGLGLVFLALLGVGAVLLPTRAQDQKPDDVAPPGAAWTLDTVDPDALAARMPALQDVYRRLRDESLAVYARSHPAPTAADAPARRLIRLMACVQTWNDPFGEGLWELVRQEAAAARQAGLADPFLDYVSDVVHPLFNRTANASILTRADAFAATGYPGFFKVFYYSIALRNLAQIKSQGRADDDEMETGFTRLLEKWGQAYRAVIAAGPPHALLYQLGENMQELLSHDATWLPRIHDEIDADFDAAAPDHPVRLALDGLYLTDEAWLARGDGTNRSVTPEGWSGFRSYLQQADEELEAAYVQHPGEAEIADLMVKVELGQGRGRPRMEQWFGRAVAADPLDLEAYNAKFWYLEPRWYGSERDLVDFGRECLHLPNAPPNVASAFFSAMAQAYQLDRDAYRRPGVWEPLSQAYQQFLEKYPQSIRARTGYAVHAAQGGHWAVAREQFAILGDHWDRADLSLGDHARYVQLANNPPPEDAPAPAATTATDPGPEVRTIARVIAILSWLLSPVGL